MDHDADCCGGHGHGHAEHNHDSIAEEAAHFRDVVASFHDYFRFFELEIKRREQHAAKLPADYLRRLPPDFLERPAKLRQAMEENQCFLDAVAQAQGGGEDDEDDDEEGGSSGGGLGTLVNKAAKEAGLAASSSSSDDHPPRSTAEAHSKVRSVLHSLARDWSEEGKEERHACYAPMLEELGRLMPVTDANRNKQRVLIPGCGTARLLWEVVARGYCGEGNEFSLPMLFASHFLLNCTENHEEWTVYPWMENPNNCLSFDDLIREVRIPDWPGPAALVNPHRCLQTNKVLPPINPEPAMSMSAGDFLSIYSHPKRKESFDAVLTCFFIDCAPVLPAFVDAIWHCLKPGGLWINLGPLLYHWQLDGAINSSMSAAVSSRPGAGPGSATASGTASGLDERFLSSVELPWEDVKHLILSSGFDITREEHRTRAAAAATTYAANSRSLLKSIYEPIFFTAVKKDKREDTA